MDIANTRLTRNPGNKRIKLCCKGKKLKTRGSCFTFQKNPTETHQEDKGKEDSEYPGMGMEIY